MNSPSAKERRLGVAGRLTFPLQRVGVVVLFIAAVILVLDSPALAQCAMCQGASAAGSDGGAVYNRSTLFMLCVPYLLLGGVAGYVVYAFRRARPSSPATADTPDSIASSSGSEPERG